MQRFTQLFYELDSTTRTSEKLRALEAYFAAAEPADAAWALYFLIGRKIKRAVSTRDLRVWTAEFAHLPGWLVEESYDSVGDLAETLALVLPPVDTSSDIPLHRLVEERLVPLPKLEAAEQRAIVERTWRELDQKQTLVWHKLITGEFRVGVARTLVARALAAVAGVAAAEMSHRLMGHWEPTADDFRSRLTVEAAGTSPARPYPFFLAHPLQQPATELGDVGDWQLEWKWDGIRAQLIRRAGQVLVWSRGEELVTDRYPEVADVGRRLPEGTVVDGEIMAWRGEQPLPFAVLQRRIGRLSVDARLLESAPVALVAYDLLELGGVDVRSQPLAERRAALETLAAGLAPGAALHLSPIVAVDDWRHAEALRAESRERQVEGLMLKRRASPYGVGRPRGDWWKWKIEPHTIDAVLIYAQRGHGRRASLYTDYTFGVWHEGALVPVAKAYSGLTDEEIAEVDQFVRRHTLERFGPVRVVEPELVFELHFEGVQASRRHKAGLAVRLPRMARWRRDKRPADADSLAALQALAAVAEAAPQQP